MISQRIQGAWGDKIIPSGSLEYTHTVGRACDNILIIAGKLQSTCFLEYSIASEREKKYNYNNLTKPPSRWFRQLILGFAAACSKQKVGFNLRQQTQVRKPRIYLLSHKLTMPRGQNKSENVNTPTQAAHTENKRGCLQLQVV
jgi:hypothetical protein